MTNQFRLICLECSDKEHLFINLVRYQRAACALCGRSTLVFAEATGDAPGSIEIGDVVQIDPESDPAFGGCFLLVDKVTPGFVRGFVSVPHEKGQPPGQIYYRVAHKNIVKIGPARWIPEDLGREA